MTKYKIIDNLLSDSDFTKLAGSILPIPTGSKVAPISIQSRFGWDYTSSQVGGDEQDRFKKVTDIEILNSINNWYMSHMLYYSGYQSQVLQYFGPLIDKINPLALYRVQANLTVQQEKRGRTLFHIDYMGKTSMTTSIFYMNTTNGPTILEDGTEIECRANRLVSYPHETYHAAVLCTDQPYRIVINFNYFKEMELP